MNVLSIDPGKDKCGVAIVSSSDGVLFRKVLEIGKLDQFVRTLVCQYRIDRIIIGNGTNSKTVGEIVFSVSKIAPKYVDEYFTSMEARKRYFVQNPPKGLGRLIPTSMQVPKEPIDDYVAIILAERYLNTLT
jgi:RNase H-fold protein (predicted Holliday junction resolvase)